ncbi:MAG: hypothetical protein ACYTBJ_06805, partial [Planctomycetota bacterium]
MAVSIGTTPKQHVNLPPAPRVSVIEDTVIHVAEYGFTTGQALYVDPSYTTYAMSAAVQAIPLEGRPWFNMVLASELGHSLTIYTRALQNLVHTGLLEYKTIALHPGIINGLELPLRVPGWECYVKVTSITFAGG